MKNLLLLLCVAVIATLLVLLWTRHQAPSGTTSTAPPAPITQAPAPTPTPAAASSTSSSEYSADAILQLVADTGASTQGPRTKRQCDKIILPTYQITSMNIEEAVGELIKLGRENSSEPLPKITLQTESLPHAEMSLQLRNVPLSEALRYVTELGNITLKFEEDEVILQSKTK